MDKFIIIQHLFDSMENHYPWYSEFVGYVDTEEEARCLVEKLNNSDTYDYKGEISMKYKGWDGGTYPWWEYKKVGRY